ncbi:hypothetical protein B0H14DRAFT_2629298 [Mycena olivaceomarginata]|nr:hypothetical protein B0H14DRAFT_2629298 [Mycena olivaceomarginata]
MSKEADFLYKWGLHKLWDLYTNTVHVVDFRHYVPVEADTVDRCNERYEGPSKDEFTLNFNQGFMTSLWNKTIQKLCKIFLEKHTAGLGWNLANVMEEYVKGELYGQLQRSQQEWARWQPRFLPLLGWPENESEIHARMEQYQDHCQTHINSHSNKYHKLAKQQKTVAKMIKIKSVNGTPDLEVWHLLKGMLNYLNVAGMSSEENDVENHTGYLSENSKGTRGNPRLPRGLPRKMFDEEWLAVKERRPDYEGVLGISADVFEFMVAATSSMAG